MLVTLRVFTFDFDGTFEKPRTLNTVTRDSTKCLLFLLFCRCWRHTDRGMYVTWSNRYTDRVYVSGCRVKRHSQGTTGGETIQTTRWGRQSAQRTSCKKENNDIFQKKFLFFKK